MKKKVLALLSPLLLFFLVACNTQNEETPADNANRDEEITEEKFIGTIEEIYDETSAIIAVDSGSILNSADKVSIDLSKASENETFEMGDRVEVTYDGEIRESYPAQINTLFIEKVE